MTPKVLPEALIEELLAAAGKATPGPQGRVAAHTEIQIALATARRRSLPRSRNILPRRQMDPWE
jgi:hypothetical protein